MKPFRLRAMLERITSRFSTTQAKLLARKTLMAISFLTRLEADLLAEK